MYAKRLQLTNYGPITDLDIEFPFREESPVPIVLVGPNGSGKSVVLSHIVNPIMAAKEVAFPGTPEVDAGKTLKLRSNSYVSYWFPVFLFSH
ncbi:MAG: AAA family ATPase [Dehalococcoidia bacterium]|nr:AAA family ATPase [Dehalococcoidia bacterium]